jgi:hypothetical protein
MDPSVRRSQTQAARELVESVWNETMQSVRDVTPATRRSRISRGFLAAKLPVLR